MHDTRMAPRSKLVVSARRLQEQRLQPRKSVLGSSPGLEGSIVRKLSTIKEQRQDKSCLFRRGDYRNKGHSPEKLSWVPVPLKMYSVNWELIKVDEHR
jgi:hypothetical protein